MSHQIKNINRERYYKQESNGNSGVKKYNNRNVKFIKGLRIFEWQKNKQT